MGFNSAFERLKRKAKKQVMKLHSVASFIKIIYTNFLGGNNSSLAVTAVIMIMIMMMKKMIIHPSASS